MIVFTYKDYLKYEKLTKYELKDKKEEYILEVEQRRTHQYSDKIFKEILSNKKEFLGFIKKYLDEKELENLKEKDIEKYNKEFITSEFKKKESDIIYEILSKGIYILVEHQSKIDYRMPERMTEYCLELVRDINKNNKGKKRINPVIFPVVLYTGGGTWNVDCIIKESKQYKYKTFKYAEYNLIDINKYSKEEFIKEDTGLSKALLFEKVNSKKEFKEVMSRILKRKLTKDEIKYIQIILAYSNKIKEFMPHGRDGVKIDFGHESVEML